MVFIFQFVNEKIFMCLFIGMMGSYKLRECIKSDNQILNVRRSVSLVLLDEEWEWKVICGQTVNRL